MFIGSRRESTTIIPAAAFSIGVLVLQVERPSLAFGLSVRKPLPSPEELQNLPPDGGKQYNRLVFEENPYLPQHATNPENWYPWGDGVPVSQPSVQASHHGPRGSGGLPTRKQNVKGHSRD